MQESFREPSTTEGQPFSTVSIETLREYAYEESGKFLHWAHERLLDRAFKEPGNMEVQNLMMFTFNRLQALSEFNEVVEYNK